MTVIANLPDIRPSLYLDFLRGSVDPRLIDQRASNATVTKKTGQRITVGNNTPRVDYDPLTNRCLGFLMEDGRTNSLTYPLNLKNPTWVTTPDIDVSPADEKGFFKLSYNGTNTSYRSLYAIGAQILAGNVSTFSLEVKKGSLATISLALACDNAGDVGGRAVFNLNTGSISYSSPASSIPLSSIWGKIKQTGDDTYLISLSVDFSGRTSAYNGRCYIYPGEYLSQSVGDIYIKHPFIEWGHFPTSFIGGSGSATSRSPEQLSLSVTSEWFNQSEGTFICSYSRLSDKGLGNQIPFMVSDGTGKNIMCISDGPNGVADRALAIFNDSNAALGSTLNYAAGQIMARAIRYKGRSVATCVNSGAISSAVADVDALPFSLLTIGYAPYFSASRLNGHVRYLAYYPIALTDSQIQRLTAV